MRRILLFFFLLFPVTSIGQTPGRDGFAELRHCVMENDVSYCRAMLTPESIPYFDRFVSYKLMPCLPTDFTYTSEETGVHATTVKVQTHASGSTNYILRLIFTYDPFASPLKPKLDLPATFRRGLGENWQDQLQLSEQLFVMMRQNMGDKLTCDMLDSLVKPH